MKSRYEVPQEKFWVSEYDQRTQIMKLLSQIGNDQYEQNQKLIEQNEQINKQLTDLLYYLKKRF